MPNWCENYVTFEGDSDNIQRLKEDISSSKNNRLFETLIGKHPDWSEDDWYNLNCDWYGTKWDIPIDETSKHYQEHLLTSGASLILGFGSAWSPTINATQKICEKYNVFGYHWFEEPGMNFYGKVDINDKGLILTNLYYEDIGEGTYEIKGFEDWFSWFTSQADYFDEEESEMSKEEWVEEYFGYLTDEEKKEALEYLYNLELDE